MAERPIIFSAPMVIAILAGRKTMTRRILGNSGPGRGRFNIFNAELGWSDSYVLDPGNAGWRDRDTPWKAGDRLWVRETWAHDAGSLEECRSRNEDALAGGETFGPYYRATEVAPDTLRWRSPIHMPRWASRLTLHVTDVRVQRLQEISEEDAQAEGCPAQTAEELAGMEARGWFRDLWESIHGPGSWDANPWVAAISFEVEHHG